MLLQQFTQGERGAFTHIYQQEWPAIFQFARKYLEREEDAKDVTADSFVKLWHARAHFNDLDHIKAFLRTTVRNQCIDQLRHQRMRSERHAEILHTLKETGERKIQLEQLRAELMQLVYAEVEKLPPRMREVFLLSYQEGLKPAEIAARLQLSVQTVSNRKATAIQILKQALGPQTLLLALLLSLEIPASGLS